MLKLANTSGARLPSKRIALITLLALGTSLCAFTSASANPGMPGGQPPAPGQMQQPGAPGPQESGENEVQQVLARYGEFMKHEKYGDVWKPTQVAQGWRPYEPCHWVYNQEMKSWFFDDKTEWGAIVHHYGRWTLDQQQGWLWVPGGEFGPGWVSWEMRGNEVGWAPLPPEQDGATVESAAFKGDPNLWIFVAFDTLGKSCGAGAPPPPQPRAMMPAMPAPMPAPMPAMGGAGFVTGGYVPSRIVIVNGCYSNPRWCHYWPGRHWNWPRPHNPHFPGGHRPNDNAGGHKPYPDQKCGIAGQFCKPVHTAGTPLPGTNTHCRASWCSPNANRPHWTPTKQVVNHRPHFPNRFVNNGPRFNNRMVMHQPRMNVRPMHMQQRSFAPRQSFAPRMNSGMRFAGNGGRRR